MSSLEDFQRAQADGTTVGHEWGKKQEEQRASSDRERELCGQFPLFWEARALTPEDKLELQRYFSANA